MDESLDEAITEDIEHNTGANQQQQIRLSYKLETSNGRFHLATPNTIFKIFFNFYRKLLKTNGNEFPPMTHKGFDVFRNSTHTLCILFQTAGKLSDVNPIRIRVKIAISSAAYILYATIVKMSRGKISNSGTKQQKPTVARKIMTSITNTFKAATGITGKHTETALMTNLKNQTNVTAQEVLNDEETTSAIAEVNLGQYTYNKGDELDDKMENLLKVLKKIGEKGAHEGNEFFKSKSGKGLFTIKERPIDIKTDNNKESTITVRGKVIRDEVPASLLPKLVQQSIHLLSRFQEHHGDTWRPIPKFRDENNPHKFYIATELLQETVKDISVRNYDTFLEAFDVHYTGLEPVLNPASPELRQFVRLDMELAERLNEDEALFWEDGNFGNIVNSVTGRKDHFSFKGEDGKEKNLAYGRFVENVFALLNKKI